MSFITCDDWKEFFFYKSSSLIFHFFYLYVVAVFEINVLEEVRILR